MADPVASNINALKDLLPTLKQIKDGHLALLLEAALAAGNVKGAESYVSQLQKTQPDIANQVQQFINTHKFDPVSKTWGTAGDVLHNAEGLGNAANSAVTGGLTDITGFLSALTNKNTWLRVGEGLIGIILLGIGVSIIAKSTSVGQSAIKVGKTAAKVVPK